MFSTNNLAISGTSVKEPPDTVRFITEEQAFSIWTSVWRATVYNISHDLRMIYRLRTVILNFGSRCNLFKAWLKNWPAWPGEPLAPLSAQYWLLVWHTFIGLPQSDNAQPQFHFDRLLFIVALHCYVAKTL